MKKNLLSGILVAGVMLSSLSSKAQTLWTNSGNNIGTSAIADVCVGPFKNLGLHSSYTSSTAYFYGLRFNWYYSGVTPIGTTNISAGYSGSLMFGNNETGSADLTYSVSKISGSGVIPQTAPNNSSFWFPFSIKPSGKIGIGTRFPTAQLHIASTNDVDGTQCKADAIIEGTLMVGGTTAVPTTCPTTPNLKLVVNGVMGASEVRVSLNTWCDYVFNKDYQLKSLKEVDAYIQANKHLPEVPSEKEVVENGVAMGEMMKIHMKKIEELTLYLIELQKQNEKLAAEIAALKQ